MTDHCKRNYPPNNIAIRGMVAEKVAEEVDRQGKKISICIVKIIVLIN
jgi:hypothetical protein